MGNKTATEVARAFINGKRLSKGNYLSTGKQFLLFGNVIAEKNNDWGKDPYPQITQGGGFYIQDCGWCSSTTATALNALPSVRLRRCKGEWIWDEKRKWDGNRMFIEYKN